MSQDWYLINPPHQQLSGYEFDYLSNFGFDSFAELLDSYIAEDVEIYNTELSDYIITKSIVNDKVNGSSLTKFTLSLLLPLDVDCNTGMYIRYKDNYWIITSNVNDNYIYKKLNAELCTYTLKFQHPKTGEILSYPCITSNRIQGIGEKETNIMTLPAGNKVVLLPFDKNTILLQNSATKIWRFFVDNHPINPRPYKLTFADTTSRHGLVELYCTEDELIPNKDRIDLGICDYFEPTAPSHDDKYITITSSGKLVIGGIQRTYTATLFENNVEQPFNPIWNIDYNSMPEKCFVIMYEGNKCMIRIKDDYEIYNHIGKELIISCSTEDGIVSTDYKTIVSI